MRNGLIWPMAPSLPRPQPSLRGVREFRPIRELSKQFRRDDGAMKSQDAGPTDIPILEETIGENFERTVAANPDGDALVDMASDRRWTYAQLNDEVDVVARGLMALGIDRGERVGIWAPICPEWTMVQYATAKIGAILVTLNPAYRTHELGYVLKQSGIRTLISATSFKTSDYVSMVDDVRAETPQLQEVLYLDTDDWRELVDKADAVAVEDPTDQAELAGEHPADQHPIHLGHDGFPQRGHAQASQLPQQRLFHRRAQHFPPRGPPLHPGAVLPLLRLVIGTLGCTSHGATMMIPAPEFEPRLTLDAFEQESCTGVYGVPTMFIRCSVSPTIRGA